MTWHPIGNVSERVREWLEEGKGWLKSHLRPIQIRAIVARSDWSQCDTSQAIAHKTQLRVCYFSLLELVWMGCETVLSLWLPLNNVAIRHVVILWKKWLEFLNYKWWRHHMIDRQGCIILIYKMNNTAFQIIVEYRTKYSNKIIFSKLVTVYYFTCQTYPWR